MFDIPCHLSEQYKIQHVRCCSRLLSISEGYVNSTQLVVCGWSSSHANWVLPKVTGTHRVIDEKRVYNADAPA